MTTYIVAIHLVVEVGAKNPRADIAAQLDAIFGDTTRRRPGQGTPLLDWAVAGVDLAASIVPVALPAGYRPGESAFPACPAATVPSARRRPRMAS